jgi:hypothetical protein
MSGISSSPLWGQLTLTAGYLEVAIINIVCGIEKTEAEINADGKWRTNKWWCDKLAKIAPHPWAVEQPPLKDCLANIRDLYKQRNRFIHAAME